ncbi:ferrous iron transport protein B [Gaoshiqia sediminis]|uniref:Ferrous iron transport protein B n=1 Tax=Gaoshiqia sediminis TaxID=2986998 RepID=A0AA41YBI8_9BACT|nr:ferrous iron transport protein B [Gaoshiqia sediminis]MCW0484723.1 ferrous iron transport protein B [Gaoshiqia sediminis]
MRLSEVKNNDTVIITKVLGHGSFRKRITEMGFVKGKEVKVIKNAPFRGPIEFKILDYNITLRRSEANLIEVISLSEAKSQVTSSYQGVIDQEILKRSASEKGKIINIALVGNPNCGKTTLFNYLSGAKEHVGNYSGVTINAKKAGFKKFGYQFNLVDLPGTYSLTAYSPEEIYVRKFIWKETPDIVINVIDSSNLERNLFLTTQLIDMDIKVICALNMYDELLKNKSRFDYEKLGKLIGIPIIPTISSKGRGIDDLLQKAIDVYEDRDPIVRHIHINYGEEIEKAIRRIRARVKANKPITDKISSRFLSLKLLEKDNETLFNLSKYANFEEIKEVTREECKRIEALYNEDSETIITDAKYGFIAGALKETFKQKINHQKSRSERIDQVLTHPFWGLPIFVVLIFTAFFATFRLGNYPMGWIESLVGGLSNMVTSVMNEGMLRDLLTNGIIDGTGSVLVFLPNILILFFFISLMEDSGYMARAAFIMDKIMHFFGLHGRSFIPMIMGFGCNVPAIMATRTLRNPGDRLLTMLIIPFMSCSARLPVYVLFISAFFPTYPGLVLAGLYFTGILIAFIVAQVFNKTLFRNKETPFVLELPPYRIPTLRNIVIHMWDKTYQYLKKIAGVILIGVIIIWALGYFPRHSAEADHISEEIVQIGTPSNQEQKELLAHLHTEQESIRLKNSYLGQIGEFVAPVMQPLGFDWKMSISLLAGLPAKEIVVSTMGVLYQVDDTSDLSLTEKLRQERYTAGPKKGKLVITGPIALAFLIFVLIYFPCIGVIATIRNESGKLFWAIFTMVYTTLLAWVLAYLTLLISSTFFSGL